MLQGTGCRRVQTQGGGGGYCHREGVGVLSQGGVGVLSQGGSGGIVTALGSLRPVNGVGSS